jgi:hypothetical protein
MPGIYIDADTFEDPVNGQDSAEPDALINKLAQDLSGVKNSCLVSGQSAPENILNRYELAAVKSIADLPEGILKAVTYDLNHPLDTLEVFGMGAGMGLALKTVLPESGPAGEIAAGVLASYFTYQATRPIIAGFKQAGQAVSMDELNLAAMEIADAGGSFIVNSAVGAAGYHAGGALAERLLASDLVDGLKQAKNSFYDRVGGDIQKLKFTAAASLESRLGMASELSGRQLNLLPEKPFYTDMRRHDSSAFSRQKSHDPVRDSGRLSAGHHAENAASGSLPTLDLYGF